jgi:hypothetical protein
MAYCAMAILIGVFVVATIVVLKAATYPAAVRNSAAAALFLDIMGVAALVWKVVLPTNVAHDLEGTVTANAPRGRESSMKANWRRRARQPSLANSEMPASEAKASPS